VLPARATLCEDLRLSAAADYPAWWSSALGAAALWLARQGRAERAVEVYALAARLPSIAQSRWWYDVVGQHVAAAGAALPVEGVAAAEQRGRAGDPQTMLRELLAELEAEGSPA
jgi:hypothetical protein